MSAVSLPLVPALKPSWTSTRARQLVVVAVGVIAIAAFTQVRIPMWPVPITGSTLPVLLLGFAVGWRLAIATTGVYLAIGVLGVPVFTQAAAGAEFLALPSGGYIVGYVLAAALIGTLAHRGWHADPRTVVAGMVLGNLVIYAVGVSWLAAVLGLDLAAALRAGLVPFLIGDAIKIAIAAAVLPALHARIGER